MKFRLSEIAEICGGTLHGEDVQVGSIVTDSRDRLIGDDALMVAMRGVNHDAHDFVEDMLLRGVRGFLVEREVSLAEGCGAVVVEDSLRALQQLATVRRERFGGVVVGITGSNGKTVVKEWIAQCAPRDVKMFRSPRSYNSQLGVALSLMMMEDDCKVAVIEAGISKPFEMARLERMIRPDVVVFTSMGDAHQNNFESAHAKMTEKLTLAEHAEQIIYDSTGSTGEYRSFAEEIRRRFADRVLIDACDEETPMEDTASQRNARLVAAFCEAMGYAKPDFAALQPVAMRLEVKQGIGDALIIDDSYNSDINSLVIALNYLASVAGSRRRIVVLADILGSDLAEDALAREVAAYVNDANIDMFIGIGEAIASTRPYLTMENRFFRSTDEMLARFTELDFATAAVLVKGNRAAQTERVSRRLELKSHTTVLEVNLRAMERNINYFRSVMPASAGLVAMIKASGYGAGEEEVARMLQHQGVAYLAVAFADEGVALRRGGITMPIVVLNADDASFEAMIDAALEPEIYGFRSLEAFVRAVDAYGARNYPIHLKLDTGMHRLGFMAEDMSALLDKLDEYVGRVRVASVFTHLCVADDPSQDDFTRHQIALFDSMSRTITEHLPYRVLRHAAASAAIVRFPEAHFDMCRLGLGLYGFGYVHNDALEMCSTLRTRIVQIRTLDEGETVGYGRAGVVSRPMRVATIPIGYADGLNRHLGDGRWSMLVGGVSAPTIGRICMDSCMIDVTEAPQAAEGDEVVIFSPVAGNTVEDMAAVLETIPYEVLTSVSKRVKRIYINE
ncbi:MAG: alanine racemase [Alistipes sp.]|nr:alanine racemase [Alistipes sp.]